MPKTVENYPLTAQEVKAILAELINLQDRVKILEVEIMGLRDSVHKASKVMDDNPTTISIRIHCPDCHNLHIDEGEFKTKPHHTHACQFCGNVWRPALVNTVGVRFLPGFKNG